MTTQEENLDFFEENFKAWFDDPAYKGKYVVIHDKKVKKTFDEFPHAIEFAVSNFPEEDFVVQQVIRAEDQINFIRAAL